MFSTVHIWQHIMEAHLSKLNKKLLCHLYSPIKNLIIHTNLTVEHVMLITLNFVWDVNNKTNHIWEYYIELV